MSRGSWKKIGPARENHGVSVYLIEEDGRRVVRKEYDRPSRGFQIEKDFYLRHSGRTFQFLRIPNLIDAGERHLLLEYVPREVYTRDSILDRDWSDADVKLWVDALLELHQLEPSKQLYSLTRRWTGTVYPIVRAIHQLREWRGTFSPEQWRSAAKLIGQYAACRPFVKYVCTHFDLQTYNYTFVEDERQMSLVDFEFPYHEGDPYFDVIYYISIPTCDLRRWTFQKRILKAFYERVERLDGYNAGRGVRTRLLLLLANMARHDFFREDAGRRAIYERNIRLLLDDRAFDAFWSNEIAS